MDMLRLLMLSSMIENESEHKEMEKLRELLKEEEIPCYPGFRTQTVYFGHKGKPVVTEGIPGPGYGAVCSVIEDGELLEISGLTDNGTDVQGSLTADDVFTKIKNHWNSEVQ